MPSFLSKVFGRKKQDEHGSDASGSLLEGKFEAVSPTISPTAEKFLDGANANGNGTEKENDEKEKERGKEKEKEKGKDKETGFSLLRPKSAHQGTPDKKTSDYRLTLNLPGPKNDSNARALGAVFEADPAELLLSDAVIGQRRLNPLETLVLVRACSQAIMARGLETLGIMHPHWYSASPETQRRLISLFIHSLAPNSPITTLSPSLSSPASTFESEISYSNSPHDVAAVLRWGFRHLQLDGSSFGNDAEWYKRFFEAEKSAQYPPKAFTEKLALQVPATHFELLTATLDLFSSLAAHSEANSISGSKLSKLIGVWLLATERVQSGDDWLSFYSRWDRTGRMMEHLFLSHIRNEVANHRMPKRLTELVQKYPYAKYAQSSESDLLPRPRFSTRRYDALFVHIDTEVPSLDTKPSRDLLQLTADALKAELAVNSNEYVELWIKVRQAASEDGSDPESLLGKYLGLSHILSDETIRLLSLLPSDDADANKSAFNLFIPSEGTNGLSRKRSMSLNGNSSPDAAASRAAARREHHATEGTLQALPSISTSAIGIDWTQFSTSGFLENVTVGPQLAATLMDKDVEVTVPRAHKKTRSGGSTHRSRKSLDTLPPITIPSSEPKPSKEPTKLTSKATQISLIQLDEAFIDFWSDALFDPISADWPRFIICRFKASVPGLELEGGRKVEWMVLEQAHVKPKPPPASAVTAASATSETSPTNGTTESTGRSGRPTRASSPRPSFRSDVSDVLLSTKKRFSFLGSRSSSASRDKDTKGKKSKKGGAASPKVGEMGEILKEEEGEGDGGKGRLSVGGSTLPKQSVEVPQTVKEEKEEKEENVGKAVPAAGVTAVVAGVAAVSAAAAVVAEAASSEDKEAAVEKTEVPPATTEPATGQQTAVVASEVAPEPTAVAPVEPEPIAKEPEAAPVSVPEVEVAPVPTSEAAPEPAPAAEEPVVEPEPPVPEETPAAVVDVPEATPAAPVVVEVQEPTPSPDVVPAVEGVISEPVAEPAPAVEEPASVAVEESVPIAVAEVTPEAAAPAEEPSEVVEAEKAQVEVEAEPVTEVQTAVEEPAVEEAAAVEEPKVAAAPEPEPEPVQEVPHVEEAAAAVELEVEPPVAASTEEAAPAEEVVDEPAAPEPEPVTAVEPEPESVQEPAASEPEAPAAEPVVAVPIEVAEEPAALEPEPPVAEPVVPATAEVEEAASESAETKEPEVADPQAAEEPVEPAAPVEVAEDPVAAVQESELVPEPIEEKEPKAPVAEPVAAAPTEVVEEPVAAVQEPEPVPEHAEMKEPEAAEPEAVEEPVATLAPAEVTEEPVETVQEPEPVPEPTETEETKAVEEQPATEELEPEPVVAAPTEEAAPESTETKDLPTEEPSAVEAPAPVVESTNAVISGEAAPEPETAIESAEATPVAEPSVDMPVIVNETVYVPEAAEEVPPQVTDSAPDASSVDVLSESAPQEGTQVASEPKTSAAPTFAEDTLVAEPVADTKASEPVTMLPDLHVEPLQEPSPGPGEDAAVSQAPVPVVDAEVPTPAASSVPAEVVEPSKEEVEEHSDVPEVKETVEAELPPAPENVVLSGETLGPQVALSTSEPAVAAHEEPVTETEVEPTMPPGLSDGVAEEKEAAEETAPADVSHEPVESAEMKDESSDASKPTFNEPALASHQESNGHVHDTEAEENTASPVADEAS